MTSAGIVVYAALIYLGLGLVVGSLALLLRASALDSRLARSPRRVRLVLLPGSAVFWPLVFLRVLKGRR